MRLRKRDKILTLLFALIVMLGVGYAYLTTNLNINGTANVNKATWDVHFENIRVDSGSITPTNAATIGVDGISITYGVTLSVPGDYYRFLVDVKNAGTIDAMIGSVTSRINGVVVTNLPAYLEYYVTYEDGVAIQDNHLLAAGAKETYEVHIGYKKDISPSELPTSDQPVTVNMSIDYTQKTTDSTPKPEPAYTFVRYNDQFYFDSNIPAEVPTGDDYNDVLIEENPWFLRFQIKDNKIKAAYVGAVINDNVYYLKGGDGGASYNANKEVLNSIFGTNNCHETIYPEQTTYFCEDDSYDGFISGGTSSIGYANLGGGSSTYCAVYENYAYCTYQ
jgi:hypothetical protein